MELAAAGPADDGVSDADGPAPDAAEDATDAPAAVAEVMASREAFEEITVMRGRSIEVIRVPVVRDVPVEPEPAPAEPDCRPEESQEYRPKTACPERSRESLEALGADRPGSTTVPPAESLEAEAAAPAAEELAVLSAPAFSEATPLSAAAVPDDTSGVPAAGDVSAAAAQKAPSAIALGEAAPLSESTVPDKAAAVTRPTEALAETGDTGSATIPATAAFGEAAPLSAGAVPGPAADRPRTGAAGSETRHSGSVTVPVTVAGDEAAAPDTAAKAPVEEEAGVAASDPQPGNAGAAVEPQEARLAPKAIAPEPRAPQGQESAAPDGSGTTHVVGTYLVFFDSGTADLNDGAREILAEVVRAARKTSFSAIRASGHSDPMGSEEYNEWLSEQRTLAVVDFLIASGLDKQRIVTESYGSTDPLIPAAGERAQMQNRRVEIQILK